MRTIHAILFTALLAIGCGPPSTPASGVCNADSDCQSGLKCLSFGISNNGTCTASQQKICTLPCAKDSDCITLQSPNGGTGGFTCFTCPPVPAACGQLAH